MAKLPPMPSDPIAALNRQNLLVALQLIASSIDSNTEQLKRLADQGEPVTIDTIRKPEFGRAEYGDRDRRDQTNEFAEEFQKSGEAKNSRNNAKSR